MQIIAVDDEKLALEMLIDSIEKALPGVTVHGFRQPSEAIEYVKEKDCEIAFLDIKMRGMTGLELARRIKDVRKNCNIIFVTGYSEYSLDAFRLYASDYLLKPATPDAVKQALEHLRHPIKPKEKGKLRVQCFGNFDVFYPDGKPVLFQRAKTKELFAYLVDRMGATCTMGELTSVIWGDGPDTHSRQSNLRNLIHDMKKTLAEAGADNIILKSRNTISLDRDGIDCDYYDFLRHIPYAINSYRGEYMTQYSWAELTTASLSLLP